jgi:hypothetical protein
VAKSGGGLIFLFDRFFTRMECKFKGTPPRLPILFQRFDAPLYFVTFNTLLKRPLLANDSVHAAFHSYAESVEAQPRRYNKIHG